MWVKTNPNPGRKEVGDSAVRALSFALKKRWVEVYDDLCRIGREEYNMPSSDSVISRYLHENGFEPFLVKESEDNEPVTIAVFSWMNPEGTFVIGTGGHVVAVINGDYYDSWDSGSEIPSFFWKIKMEPNKEA